MPSMSQKQHGSMSFPGECCIEPESLKTGIMTIERDRRNQTRHEVEQAEKRGEDRAVQRQPLPCTEAAAYEIAPGAKLPSV